MFGRVYEEDYRDSFYNGADLYRPTLDKRKYWPTITYEKDTTRTHAPGVAWYQWYMSRLRTLPPSKITVLSPYDFYIAGETKGGSSIRGGAKMLRSMGLIRSYYWSDNVDVITNYILNYGPAVAGSSWTEDMMAPEYETGRVTADGPVVGQNAYVIDGVNLNRNVIRLSNTWGSSWGRNGTCYLPLDSFDALIKDGGEVCLPVGFGKKWRPLRR